MSVFTTADQRLQRQPGVKGVILGPAKIGKTSLLWTLPPESTLFIDAEAGDLAVDGWSGTSIDVRKAAVDLKAPTWEFCRALGCWLGGPNPAVPVAHPYSAGSFDFASNVFGDASTLDRFDTFFVDSLTVASRICFQWCLTQPRAFSDKTGRLDTRGAYGLLKDEMVGWLTQIQHARGKNVWFLGILDQVTDDFKRTSWVPQIEGSGTQKALLGIVDQVITMAEIDFGEGGKGRAFVTQLNNQWGFPAGDRSGQLDPIEEPHLGKLTTKIVSKARARALNHDLPACQPATLPADPV